MANWAYKTRVGTFVIEERDDGRFHVLLGDEALGHYHSPHAAADMLSGGHGVDPTWGNTGWLGLPRDLSRWERSD